MELNSAHRIYFLGIGGIGMSALARFLKINGAEVAGYDKTPSEITSQLEEEGIPVHFEDRPELIPFEPEIVIYTPAIPADLQEFNYLEDQEIRFIKRSEALGFISRNIFTIAVAGTHGKTTISSMITHVLKASGIAVTGFVGGICVNYNSNLILSENSKYMVVEADEYDRSFLRLFPDIAIISAMDADHLDIYGDEDYLLQSFFLFSEQIKESGKLILKSELEASPRLQVKINRYGRDNEADIKAINIRIENNRNCFDIDYKGQIISRFEIRLPGLHNVENATAAIIAAHSIGLSFEQIKKALSTYLGVKRRFEIRVQTSSHIYIDDYAHHPEEIKATVQAVKMMFPDKKITGIFQPHLFSRTRDLAEGFAESLALLDNLILLDIYPAREKPIEGINSSWLLEKIQMQDKKVVPYNEIVKLIENEKPELLLTIGAGDIDRLVEPLEKTMLKTDN